MMELPVSHTESPEEVQWQPFEVRRLQLATEGTPPGYGEPASR